MSRHQRQRRSARRASPIGRILLGATLACVMALIGGAVYGVVWVTNTAASAPTLDSLAPRIQGQLSEVFAADGTLLGYLSTDVLRKAVSGAQQTAQLRDATVAIEDRRFFKHGGVDYQGLVRAAISDVFNGSSGTQGGSTLTMQLVKNVYLPEDITSDRNLRYKIVQAKLANELEDKNSKNWILTQYLNDVPYGTVGGQSAYGVGAASQMFFDQPNLHKLSLAQDALLAGLPQAPTTYNPFLHPAAARARRSEVLHAMYVSGYITAAQQQAADADPLELKSNATYQTVKQPYVFDYIRQQLIAKLGLKTVDEGGLKVETSINLQDQQYANTALEDNEGEPGDPQAALVTVNPANGEIVAMAQNTTYGLNAGETTENYVTQALRQTGSAFKVFSLMTLIHDEDGDPDSTYYVSKQLQPASGSYPGWLPADPTWGVQTSEKSYQGVINVTKATALSDNTVYAQLGVDMGATPAASLQNVFKTAYAMGITTHQQPYFPAIIGGLSPGVTPLQMADAYSTLASGGLHYSPTIIDSVKLPSGKRENMLDTTPNRVFTPGEAYAGTQTLKTVLEYGTAAGDDPNGCPAAGKTGTTSNYTDAYFVGYTPQLSTAVWVGYAASEKESMSDVNGLGPGFGGTLAAPIWKQFMESASDGFCGDFPVPAVPFVGKAYAGAHSASHQSATYVPYGTPTTATSVTGTSTTGTGTGTTTTPGATATTPPATNAATTPNAEPAPATTVAPPSGGTETPTTPSQAVTAPSSGGGGIG
jgi:penicillin-binding protein 1A